QAFNVSIESTREVDEIFARNRCPEGFGKRYRPRKCHVLKLLWTPDVLGPDLSLASQYVTGKPVIELLRNRLECIDRLERQESAHCKRLGVTILRLVIVKVRVRRRRHHHVVTSTGSSHSSRDAPPRHDSRSRRQPAFENLIPADQTPRVSRKKRVHLPDEPALHLVFITESQLFVVSLSSLARPPLGLVRLVSTDVDITTRKELHDFGEHILHEMDRRLLRVQNVLVDAPRLADLQFLVCVPQLWICGNG